MLPRKRGELSAVLAAADPLHLPPLATLAHLGLRCGEGLGLVWRDVDLAERTVTVTHQLDRGGRRVPLKTEASRRTLDAPGELIAILRAHKLASRDTTPDALVFVTSLGTPLDPRNLRQRGLWAAYRRAGLPGRSPTLHELRHSHASVLIDDGLKVEEVSRRLGHAGIQITWSTYTHQIERARQRDELRARLDRIYGDGAPGSTVAALDGGSPRTGADEASTGLAPLHRIGS